MKGAGDSLLGSFGLLSVFLGAPWVDVIKGAPQHIGPEHDGWIDWPQVIIRLHDKRMLLDAIFWHSSSRHPIPTKLPTRKAIAYLSAHHSLARRGWVSL